MRRRGWRSPLDRFNADDESTWPVSLAEVEAMARALDAAGTTGPLAGD